jgi:glycosyltransferase involved in cell wall biosynthesis
MVANIASVPEGEEFSYVYAYVKPEGAVFADEIVGANRKLYKLGKSDREFDLRWIPKLARVLRYEKPDIIHSHAASIDSFVRILNLFRLHRSVIAFTDHTPRNTSKLLTRFLNLLTLPLVDILIGVSPHVIASYPAKFRKRMSVVEAGFTLANDHVEEPATFEGLGRFRSAHSIVIGNAGRLVARKNNKLVVNAVAELRERGHNVGCVFAGTGEEAETLLSLAAELGVADHVLFVGFVRNVPAFISLLDVFVLASFFEGAPVAVMESLAVGVPCVASDIDGVRSLVTNGQEGLLFDVDSIEGITEALERLILDGSLRKSMGEAGRVRSQDFSITETIRRYESLYRAALQGAN